MLKIVTIGTIVALTSATTHPINQDIVNEIKTKTSKWTAHEPHENPLIHWTTEEI